MPVILYFPLPLFEVEPSKHFQERYYTTTTTVFKLARKLKK